MNQQRRLCITIGVMIRLVVVLGMAVAPLSIGVTIADSDIKSNYLRSTIGTLPGGSILANTHDVVPFHEGTEIATFGGG